MDQAHGKREASDSIFSPLLLVKLVVCSEEWERAKVCTLSNKMSGTGSCATGEWNRERVPETRCIAVGPEDGRVCVERSREEVDTHSSVALRVRDERRGAVDGSKRNTGGEEKVRGEKERERERKREIENERRNNVR